LTIKLTQRASTGSIKDLRERALRSLASSAARSCRLCASPLRQAAAQEPCSQRMCKFAFPHCATLSKNLRLSTATKRCTTAQRPVTGMPASFSCQRSFPDSVALGISAPGGAQHRFGADPACTNKKPGVERRACPSFVWGGCLVAHPPERISSRLVVKRPGVRNQPHLMISEKARFVRELSPQSGLR